MLIDNAGMDGFASKAPIGGNRTLRISKMMVHQIGFNDSASAAGLDIRDNDFHLSHVSVITAPTRANPLGVAANTGIRIRGGGTHTGVIRNVYVRGAIQAIFFEGKRPTLTANVRGEDFIVKEFSGTGVYMRGRALSIRRGCSFSSQAGSRYQHIDTTNSDVATNAIDIFPGYSAERCPTYTNVGYR